MLSLSKKAQIWNQPQFGIFFASDLSDFGSDQSIYGSDVRKKDPKVEVDFISEPFSQIVIEHQDS